MTRPRCAVHRALPREGGTPAECEALPAVHARRPGFVALALFAVACASEPGAPAFLVDRPRILAIRAEPPEVRPGELASYTVLAAGPEGELDATTAQWSPCTIPLPLTESGSVATACLSPIVPTAEGPAPRLATSSDACSRFGPIASPEVQRAREPDATGGYYQPMRLALLGELGFAFERLLCPLPRASLRVAREYAQRYPPNTNPSVALYVPQELRAGDEVELTAAWPAESEEPFVILDPGTLEIIAARETMTVSWFTTAGTLERARTGTGSNRWRPPDTAGPVDLWAVLRDNRGGVSWAHVRATVKEAPR